LKRIFIYLSTLLTTLCSYTYAQTDTVLPKSVAIDERLNYDQYTSYVVPSINWLQNTPLNKERAERKRLDNFIMCWLQKNKDVTVTIPEFLIKFQSVNNEFYFLYNGSWIKYALESGQNIRDSALIKAVRGMLDYYTRDMGVKKNDYMDQLVQLDKEGKLPVMFDSSAGANNIHLYLRPSYTKKEYGPEENHFAFYYTAINFTAPKELSCRYKLEGFYEDWVPATDEFVIFPKLPPGDYTFKIQASTLTDFSQYKEQSYSFCIKPPFWKTPWFIGSAIVLLALAIYLYARQRERRIKSLSDLKHQRMIFEYDHLRSQINPHFLFNSLNTLTGMIEEEPQKAVEYSAHLSDLYRNILAYNSEDTVFLKEELEILHNYIHIQQSRFGNALQVEINIPDDIKRTKKIVPLALQLLVENAMKHNIVSQSQPLKISITATHTELTIRNNIQPKISKEKGVGLGLANIKKRYALATEKQISYGAEGKDYVVNIPLL